MAVNHCQILPCKPCSGTGMAYGSAITVPECHFFPAPSHTFFSWYGTVLEGPGNSRDVSRVTCDDCHSLCGGVASSDFFSAVGGGVGVCAYATGTTSTSVRVLNSSFYDCSSDYGEAKNFHCFSEASLFPSSSMSWFMTDHVFEETSQGNSTAYSELHRSILSHSHHLHRPVFGCIDIYTRSSYLRTSCL